MSERDPLAHQANPLYQQVTPSDERTCVERFLDCYRDEVIDKVSGLDDTLTGERVLAATDLTVKGVIKHLAWSEDSWFHGKLLGEPIGEPWASSPIVDDPDWPFHSANDESLAELISLYGDACARSRQSQLRISSLDELAARASFGRGPVNLRWLLTHMIDETARHLGHLDLLIDEIQARSQ